MISYIIPAYNCRNTVAAALDSIIGQDTKTDFEIIVVNDGSQDDTKSVVERYISLHPEYDIRLISQSNQGAASARNKGLDQAKGDLVCFVDSDDICLQGHSEKLVCGLGENCDFCFASYREVLGDAEAEAVKVINTQTGIFNAEKVFVDFISEKMHILICGSIYKMSIIRDNGLRFNHFKYAEDFNFIHRYLLCCQKVNVIDDVIYQYNICYERSKERESQELDFGNCSSIYELVLEDTIKAGWETGYSMLQYGRIPLDYMSNCLKKACYVDSYKDFKKWLLSGNPSNRKVMNRFRYKGFKAKTCIKALIVRIAFTCFPRLSYGIARRLFLKIYYR